MKPVRTRIFLFKCLIAVAGILSVATVLFWHHRLTMEKPVAANQTDIRQGSIQVGSMVRTYLYYAPPQLPASAPMLIVLHGASQTAQNIRNMTGDEFESLAKKDHFLVVYPNGYKGNWNDCRTAANYPARSHNINDESFVQDLITHFKTTAHINTSAVFAAGYSNGGQMAYRLALEMPQDFAGIATIAANLPAASNNLCVATNQPLPMLIMAGTKDPISPYNGGVESLFGKQPRGMVLSTQATIQYFAHVDGQTIVPEPYLLPHQPASGDTLVSVSDYNQVNQKEVMDYTIINGGHVIPTLRAHAQTRLGQITRDVDAPSVIWNFFSRQLPPQENTPSVTS